MDPIVFLEAWAGIEPANTGFADPCLTTWLPRHGGRYLRDTARSIGAGDTRIAETPCLAR